MWTRNQWEQGKACTAHLPSPDQNSARRLTALAGAQGPAPWVFRILAGFVPLPFVMIGVNILGSVDCALAEGIPHPQRPLHRPNPSLPESSKNLTKKAPSDDLFFFSPEQRLIALERNSNGGHSVRSRPL